LLIKGITDEENEKAGMISMAHSLFWFSIYKDTEINTGRYRDACKYKAYIYIYIYIYTHTYIHTYIHISDIFCSSVHWVDVGSVTCH
jgi:hypothetical protein